MRRRAASLWLTIYLKWVESSRQWHRNAKIRTVQVQPRFTEGIECKLPSATCSCWNNAISRDGCSTGVVIIEGCHTETTARPDPPISPLDINNAIAQCWKRLNNRIDADLVFINLQVTTESTHAVVSTIFYRTQCEPRCNRLLFVSSRKTSQKTATSFEVLPHSQVHYKQTTATWTKCKVCNS